MIAISEMEITWITFWPLLSMVVLASIAVFYTNWLLRKDRATQIYVLWYAFSLTFFLFLGPEVAAKRQGIAVYQLCGTREYICKAVYAALTDIGDEVILLSAVTGLAILPQILTYFLSGIFGAARAPKFVRQVRQLVIWSLIKFTACLGGISAASAFAQLVVLRKFAVAEFAFSSATLCIAFVYAYLECAVIPNAKALESSETLRRLHKFFTRNVRYD